MMLTTLAIYNYRSLHELVMPLENMTIITGENGTGKSNLYKALRLLANTANGELISSLAKEGGLPSTFWAGPEKVTAAMQRGDVPIQGTARKKTQRMRLGFASADFGYSVSLGLPVPTASQFTLDPEIKHECIWSAHGGLSKQFHPNARLVVRDGLIIKVKNGRQWQVVQNHVHSSESLFTQAIDPNLAPEIWQLKRYIQSWRFYDHFRSDADAPARKPQIGTFTPVLQHDGSNLAAAIQTIIEIGDAQALASTITDAFGDAQVSVQVNAGVFTLYFHQHGLLRPLSAAELSDGTLRYLLWVAALLTPRPPSMMILNEPETSLHPDLLPALARLIIKASEHSQIWIISHANRLVAALQQSACHHVQLIKTLGQTCIQGQDLISKPTWQWADGSK